MKYQQGDEITLQASTTTNMTFGRRVKVDSNGKAALAGKGEQGIGVIVQEPSSTSDNVGIRLWSAGGTFPVSAAGAIAANAQLYAAANGQVDDDATLGLPLALKCGPDAIGSGAFGEAIQYGNGEQNWKSGVYTTSAGDDAANSAVIDTGLGVAPTVFIAQTRTSAGVARAGDTVTALTSANAGKIQVDNANMGTGDLIHWFVVL